METKWYRTIQRATMAQKAQMAEIVREETQFQFDDFVPSFDMYQLEAVHVKRRWGHAMELYPIGLPHTLENRMGCEDFVICKVCGWVVTARGDESDYGCWRCDTVWEDED